MKLETTTLTQPIQFAKEYILSLYHVFPSYPEYACIQECPDSRTYTVRHGSQLAEKLFRHDLGEVEKADKLKRLITDHGYGPDNYDCLWGVSNNYPDSYMLLRESYHDCEANSHLPRDEVCSYRSFLATKLAGISGRSVWCNLWSMSGDPLYKTICATHLLQKYKEIPQHIQTARKFLDECNFDGIGCKGDISYRIFYNGTVYSTLRLAMLLAGESLYAAHVSGNWDKADHIAHLLLQCQYRQPQYGYDINGNLIFWNSPNELGGFFVSYVKRPSITFHKFKRLFDNRILRRLLGHKSQSLTDDAITHQEPTCVAVKSLLIHSTLHP